MDETSALVEKPPLPDSEPGVVASCDPPVQPAVQQPIVVQVATPMDDPQIKTDYKSELSRRLGIVQLVLVTAAIIMNIVGMVINATRQCGYEDEDKGSVLHYTDGGIWFPLFIFSLSGAFSMGAARKKTRCMIVANLVLCIMSSIFAVVMLVFAILVLGRDIYKINLGFDDDVDSGPYDEGLGTIAPYDTNPSHCSVAAWRTLTTVVLTAMWIMVYIAEFIICVWTAALCCRVFCCRHDDKHADPGAKAQGCVHLEVPPNPN